MANEYFAQVAIGSVYPGLTNPRKHFDEEKLDNLATSIKGVGIVQPILVRPRPDNFPDDDVVRYEIVAGERRFRAAKIAGLSEIPVIVRRLTTREVLEIQTIENLQREDLHPLEEADGYALMIRDYGYTAETLAEKIGRSRSYVFGRLKLLQLDEEARQAFRNGELNPSTALMIARIPTASLRARAIKEITQENFSGEVMSVRQALKHIRKHYMLLLKEASFPVESEKLGACSCKGCDKQTSNQPRDLFMDINCPADVCTDPDCFSEKKKIWMKSQISEALNNGIDVITGAAAEKEVYNGYLCGNNYVSLDSKCTDDPEHRTNREIFGKPVETVLIEDEYNQRLIEALPKKVIADKLKALGIISHGQGHDDLHPQKRENEVKAEKESAVRRRIFDSIRAEISNYTLDAIPNFPAELEIFFLRNLTRLFFTRISYSETIRLFLKSIEIQGINFTERKDNFLGAIDKATPSQCWRWLTDLMVIGDCHVDVYYFDTPPEKLNRLATALNLDVDEIRQETINEIKSEKKAMAKTKKAAKAAQATKNQRGRKENTKES
jgi:ParB/RepB/Spo0J family partition protein